MSAGQRISWRRVRDPFYALLGTVIIGTQIASQTWNPLACGVALALFGLPGIIALNEWAGSSRGGSGSTHPSSDSSSPDGSRSPSSGRQGDDQRDESA